MFKSLENVTLLGSGLGVMACRYRSGKRTLLAAPLRLSFALGRGGSGAPSSNARASHRFAEYGAARLSKRAEQRSDRTASPLGHELLSA